MMNNEKTYYSVKGKGFYSDMFPEVLNKANEDYGDLAEISKENYDDFFAPPEGYYGLFDEKGPRIEKLPEPDYVAIAENEKQALIDKATTAIIVWQTKLMMGRKLTAKETASLNASMDYIDELNAIDTSTAPDITWPEAPAS